MLILIKIKSKIIFKLLAKLFNYLYNIIDNKNLITKLIYIFNKFLINFNI